MTRFYSLAGVLAATALTTAAFAQSSTTAVKPPRASTATNVSNVAPAKKPLPINVITDSYFYGSNFEAPFRDARTGNDGAPESIGMEHLLLLKYQLNAKTSLTPALDFQHNFTRADDGLVWYDSFVTLKRSGLIERKVRGNAVALDGYVRVYVPTSAASSNVDSLGAIRVGLDPSITFGKSRFSLALSNYARYYIQTQNTGALPTLRFYSGQQLNYEFSDKVTAWLLYENDMRWLQNGATNLAAGSNADLEPGVTFKVHNRVSVTPYLNWFTSQSIKTTSFNLNATLTLL